MADLPREHPRGGAVAAAGRALSAAVFEIRREHGLTPSEAFALLAAEISSLAHRCVRSEREDAPDD